MGKIQIEAQRLETHISDPHRNDNETQREINQFRNEVTSVIGYISITLFRAGDIIGESTALQSLNDSTSSFTAKLSDPSFSVDKIESLRVEFTSIVESFRDFINTNNEVFSIVGDLES